MMAPTNPASARILELLGANTINIPSDLTIPQIAAIRAAIDAPIDFYVEAPDNIGGFIRYYDIPELIRVAAPIYLEIRIAQFARRLSQRHAPGEHRDCALARARAARRNGQGNDRPLLPRSRHVAAQSQEFGRAGARLTVAIE